MEEVIDNSRAHLTCLVVFQFNHANYITTNKQVTSTPDVVLLEGVVNLRFFVV
jgi:pantothenate kinase